MRATRTHGIAAAATALGVLLAAPALGAGGGPDPGQPPPGAPARHVTTIAPVPQQPPAGASGMTPTQHFQRVPQQPVNLHPQKRTGFRAGAELRHSKQDLGVKGVPPTRDLGR